jgi:hypothetical protein
VRTVRIAAGEGHSLALAENGEVFAFGEGGGIPCAGHPFPGAPQQLRETLADTAIGYRFQQPFPPTNAVRFQALSNGCSARQSVFVAGVPPLHRGGANMFSWWHVRTPVGLARAARVR